VVKDTMSTTDAVTASVARAPGTRTVRARTVAAPMVVPRIRTLLSHGPPLPSASAEAWRVSHSPVSLVCVLNGRPFSLVRPTRRAERLVAMTDAKMK
jgi:hypothetical protein